MYKHTQRERENKINEAQQDAYVLEAEERDLLIIYIKLQEDYKVLSRTLTQKITNPRNGLHLLFIERRKNPKFTAVRVQNHI